MTSNKRLVKDYYEKILNTGDVSQISDYIGADYCEEYNGDLQCVGVAGALNHIIGVRKTYPDLFLNIERQIAEGDWVVTMYTMTGTHSGEWMGMKPTNKKLRVTGVNVDKVTDGKIVLHTGAANMLEPLLEAGAVTVV